MIEGNYDPDQSLFCEIVARAVLICGKLCPELFKKERNNGLIPYCLLFQAYRDHLGSNLHQRNAGSFVSQQQQPGQQQEHPVKQETTSLKRQAPSTAVSAGGNESSAAVVVDVDTKDASAATAKRPKKERAKALPGEDEPEFDENLLVLDWCKLLI